jgi:transcriptional antiterminator RfaH
MSKWFAIRVTTHQEGFVDRALGEAQIQAYVPKHITKPDFAKRKATRTRPLIPGYVLVALPDDEAIQVAYGLRGVIRNSAIPLRPIEVGAMILAEACHLFDETWTPPKAKGQRYKHRWKAGDRVKIDDGPFFGFVAQVLRSNGKSRMAVLLTIFGGVTEVSVEHRHLVKPDDGCGRLAA